MENKFSPEDKGWRRDAAAAIRSQREIDKRRGENFTYDLMRNQGVMEYVVQLHGLKHFLNYTRSLSEKPKVLDVGGGVTRASSDLSHIEEWTEGLDLKATSLHMDKDVPKFLGKENVTLTSVEQLRGIKDGELAGLLSVHSIGFTKAPKLAAESINRALMPGGVVKAVFGFDMLDTKSQLGIFQRELMHCFKDLKFDTNIAYSEAPSQPGQRVVMFNLTAIKPPVKEGYSAAELFKADSEDMENQADFLLNKGFNFVRPEIEERHSKKKKSPKKKT